MYFASGKVQKVNVFMGYMVYNKRTKQVVADLA
jgi:hypothetical protein